MPKRVRMTRAKPWRHLHPDAVIVDRRSHWGNCFAIGAPGVPDAETAVALFRAAIVLCDYSNTCVAARPSLIVHHVMAAMPGPVPRLDEIRRYLRGLDLACWCPLDAPCHADVLLELANKD